MADRRADRLFDVMERKMIRALMLSVLFVFCANAFAASVLSSQTIEEVTNPDGSKIVRYQFTLQDNNSVQHIVYEGPRRLAAGTDVDADRISRYPVQLKRQTDQETSLAFQSLGDRCDPLFEEISANNFIKTAPNWQTWTQLAQVLSWHFWSREDILEILPFEPCWTNPQFTTSNKQTVMNGIGVPAVNTLNGQMQNATNIRATIEGYSPLYDEDGMPL